MSYNKTIFIAFTLNTSAIADYYRALANAFVERGYQVVIITDGQRTHKASEDTNPAIHTWPSKRPTKLTDARFLMNLIKRYKPVLVFSNFGADNISMIVSWLLRVPLRFVTYHTMLDPENERKPNKVEIFLQILRKRFVFRLVTMVLPVADALKSELSTVFCVPEERMQVFYNALAARPDLFKKELKSTTQLISAGGLCLGKGHDILINAMATVTKEYPQVKLTIYGEGRERPKLEGMIDKLKLQHNVELTGLVSHETVMKAISNAYALIHPSRYEAFPYSVLEALSVGTPIVASAVGGIPEIIRDGTDGFLVPPGDPFILAERICLLLSSTKLRNSMGQSCHTRFEETFELNLAIQNQVNWFEQKIHRGTLFER